MPAPKKKYTNKEVLAIWQAYVDRGLIPTWDTPWGFSEYLKRVYLGEIPRLLQVEQALRNRIWDQADRLDAEEDERVAALPRSESSYATYPQPPLLKRFLRTVAPQGFIYASRGYHNLAFTHANQVLPLLEDQWRGRSSYTLNLARSVSSFANVVTEASDISGNLKYVLAEGPHRGQFRPYYEFTRRVLRLWLQKQGLAETEGNWGLAYAQNICGIQVVSKVPTSSVTSFNYDSQSHNLYEAEIIVKSRSHANVVGVFVAKRGDLPGARLATPEERALYCLSNYYSCHFEFPRKTKYDGTDFDQEPSATPTANRLYSGQYVNLRAVLHKYVEPVAPWITSVREVRSMEEDRTWDTVDIPGKIHWYRVA